MQKMNAILLRGIDDYVYCDVDKPICPQEGLLIKVHACGLCGSDLRTLSSGHKHVKYPAITGHEVCGTVEEAGENYKGNIAIGDVLAVAPPVYCGTCEYCRQGRYELCMNIKELAQQWQGGFAEYMALPKEALSFGCIVVIDESWDYGAAAVAEPPSSCVNAHEKLNTGIDDTVLIIGAGPIGFLHACVANARGANRIIIADISSDRLDMCSALGFVETINSKEHDLVETVKSMTGGLGADVVITANPIGATQVQAIEAAKKGGRVAFFGGLPHGNSTPGIDTNLIHYKGLTIIGTTNFAPKHHISALKLIKEGKIPAEKLISHRLPLEKFAEGVELARSGKALKVVFEM